GSAQKEAVDVDDAGWVQVKLQNGASGTIMASRYATGAVDDWNFEIYGERGALRFSLMDANWLYIFEPSIADEPMGGRRGWTRVETIQRYPGAAAPPGRSFIGWTRALAENLHAFLTAVSKGEEPQPGLVDGLRVNQVLDAAYASADQGTWVKVEA